MGLLSQGAGTTTTRGGHAYTRMDHVLCSLLLIETVSRATAHLARLFAAVKLDHISERGRLKVAQISQASQRLQFTVNLLMMPGL